MRNIVPGQLWIGNARDARDIRAVLNLGVLAIVDLAMDEPPVSYPREIAVCRIPLVDGPGNSPAFLRLAVETVRTFLAEHVPTLVACSGGMSRSPSITATAFALHYDIPLWQSLAEIQKTGPCDLTPGLWADLEKVYASLSQTSQ